MENKMKYWKWLWEVIKESKPGLICVGIAIILTLTLIVCVFAFAYIIGNVYGVGIGGVVWGVVFFFSYTYFISYRR